MPWGRGESKVAPMTTATLTSTIRRAAARLSSSTVPAAVRTATTGPSAAGIPATVQLRWA